MVRKASLSAENAAAARAFLTRRGILDDVHAERFVRGSKRAVFDLLASTPVLARVLAWHAARTKFYDHVVVDCLVEGIRQVVIVGAGYDSRAWRFARDSVRFVEVDHPATQERKKTLAPPGGPEYVAADLSVQRLADVVAPHMTAREPVLVICEALTMFLPEDAVRSLLSHAAELGPAGSRLGVDFGTKAAAGAPVAARIVHTLLRWSGEPLLLELDPEDVPALLRDTGWSSAEMFAGADLYERFLRASELPAPVGSALTGLWSATKR